MDPSNVIKVFFLTITVTLKYEGDTPFCTQYSEGGVDGTQYAKGPYAVRINFVISYADIIF